MSDDSTDLAASGLWAEMRRHTPARIALGRSGNSIPTAELLRLGLAHAMARDAVHTPLDVAALEAGLTSVFDAALTDAKPAVLRVHSRAVDRTQYLLRPDLGRSLDDAGTTTLSAHRGADDLAIVIADGLSAQAVQAHALPVLEALLPHLPGWRVAPVVIAEQGRVAIGDPIGELLGAAIVVVLIGERPGLSSPDSLGIYITHGPHVGCSDAQRNCISNVRPAGQSYAVAAHRLAWLLNAARTMKLTGVGLKDESGLELIAQA